MLRKISKSQLQIGDSTFWIGFSLCLVIISIFPQIASNASRLIGIMSPVNFVFLFTIFLLLTKVFFLTIKLSQIEHKFKSFVQEYAIQENKRDKIYYNLEVQNIINDQHEAAVSVDKISH